MQSKKEQLEDFNEIILDEQFKTLCETVDELRLYFIIDGLGGFIWRTNHEIGHGRIQSTPAIEKDILTSRKKIEYAVRQTTRFGVDDLKESDQDITIPSDKYWKWFRWWDAWKTNLSDDEWITVNIASAKIETDISKYKPEGDWK